MGEAFEIDRSLAILICAGPSLDRLSAAAWREIQQAGAVVAVNGALAAHACLENRVAFRYAAAMDVAQGLTEKVPGFAEIWEATPAWRVTAEAETKAEAESHVVEVEWWSDDPGEGYVGGSTAMVTGNWLCNPWPEEERQTLAAVAARSGKPVPPRGFRRIAYVGLDMKPGQGGHARGAGRHQSGFSADAARYASVCRGWEYFHREGARRGVEIVNLTPGSGLEELPRCAVPRRWLRDPDGPVRSPGREDNRRPAARAE